MSHQLFILRGVPEDEADDIRSLLKENQIDFYETPAGNWGISMPALWLSDDQQLDRARSLIASYQIERSKNQHEIYLEKKAAGEQRSLFNVITEEPVRLLVLVLLVGVILYFTVMPFFGW